MSVVAINAFSTATGNGATTSFPYTFAAKSAAEVAVYVNGTIQTVGFTVTPNAGGNGGTVLFSVAPANAAAIIITTAPSFQQNTTFVGAGAYNPASVDGANDEAAIRDIFLKSLIDRAMLFPLGETAAAMPSAANRAGKYLYFDAITGQPTMAAGTTGGSGLTNGTFGDIIVTGAGATMTVGPAAVTLAKMANLAANSILGNNTGGAATPIALTGAQATAMLNTAIGDSGAGGTKGLVPAAGAGDAAAGKFYAADGTFKVPPGSGAGTTTNALTFVAAAGDAATTTFNGSAARSIGYASVGAARAGAITAGDLTISTAKLAGRTTAATGAVQEIGIDATLQLTALTLSVLKVPTAVTFQTSGGAASGSTFDGSAARIVDYSTVGALPSTPRIQTVTSAATVTPTSANDAVVITAQAVGLTLANPSGSPVQMQGIVIRLKDNGTPQTIAYGTQYRAVGVTLPTTTVASKQLYLGIIWNNDDTKWDVVSVAQQ